jgi:predicted HTH domain antitoxin
MNVVLPDRVEARLKPQEVRLDLAVGMYSSGRVTMGTAAEVADLSIPEFQRELGRRRIPVNYTAEDLTYDLQAAAELARR